MFTPPRCPNRTCREHRNPSQGFFVRHGSYHPLCRPRPVPRFRCRRCRRTFSRQTFRMDYRDHRPHLNRRLFESICSGVGIRQTSRNLGLSLRCTELKFRKIGRHLRHLNLNLRGPLPEGTEIQLDELETFEGRRNTRPLTVPVVIEREHRFIIWAESAPIRPRGKMSEARKQAIRDDSRRLGPRRDRSRRSLLRAFRHAHAMTRHSRRVRLQTDEKSVYPNLASRVFGANRVVHEQTNSKLARMTWNPLFPINHTEAVMRDLLGRLRRDSWLVSKTRWCLDLALQYFMAYRNYARPRFNYDEESPAQMLGLAPRRLKVGELLSWRQDWRERSLQPMNRSGAAAPA